MTTPSQTVGPYLLIGLPWPDGPDVVPEGTPGRIRLYGRVFDGAGEVIPDAMIETWQADPDGKFGTELPRLRPLPDQRRGRVGDLHAQARPRSATARRRTSTSTCSRAGCSTAA